MALVEPIHQAVKTPVHESLPFRKLFVILWIIHVIWIKFEIFNNQKSRQTIKIKMHLVIDLISRGEQRTVQQHFADKNSISPVCLHEQGTFSKSADPKNK